MSNHRIKVAVTTMGTVLLSFGTWPSTTEFKALAAALLCRACQALMTVSLRSQTKRNAAGWGGGGLEEKLEFFGGGMGEI